MKKPISPLKKGIAILRFQNPNVNEIDMEVETVWVKLVSKYPEATVPYIETKWDEEKDKYLDNTCFFCDAIEEFMDYLGYPWGFLNSEATLSA